jgi:hypothetical protein
MPSQVYLILRSGRSPRLEGREMNHDDYPDAYLRDIL